MDIEMYAKEHGISVAQAQQEQELEKGIKKPAAPKPVKESKGKGLK